MKLLSKTIAFVRENKIITFAFAVVILSFVFLALPGQFAHYGPLNLSQKPYEFAYKLSGYQFIFGTVKNSFTGEKIGHYSKEGVAIFVLLILTIPGLIFSKKSSFVSLVTGLVLVTVSILFFTISKAGLKAYPSFLQEENHLYSLILWVPYVLGGFIIIAGGLVLYRTVMVMKDEVKHPTQSTKGPSYNYLHK